MNQIYGYFQAKRYEACRRSSGTKKAGRVRLPCRRSRRRSSQHVHLRRRLLSLGGRQDQGSRDLPSTCSSQAEGNCATTVVHIVLVRQFQPHRRLVLRAGGVRRSPFPPWGLGGLLRRRRYSIRPSRKLISKRNAAAAAQDATERMLVGSSNHLGSMTLDRRLWHTRPGHGYIGGFGGTIR